MSMVQHNGLSYFQFDSLGIKHAIFTRHGGVSPEPWGSLNVGGTVGDDLARVRENRILSFQAMGCAPDTIFDVWQVHSADAVCANAPRPVDESYRQADIILTDKEDVTLFMRFADCVPLLMYDPRTGVVGIGPSIGPDHYEIGADVILQVMQKFGNDSERVLKSHSGKIHFNLWEANRMLLERAGVQHIEISGICTACNTRDWFSHRAEKGRTGRFGALITLQ